MLAGEHRSSAFLKLNPAGKLPVLIDADLVLFSKIDLLPYVDFDIAKASAFARAVNPHIEFLPLSPRTGEGMEAWYSWLRSVRSGARA